jgi:DNA-binding PadR family transcriptional regulator
VAILEVAVDLARRRRARFHGFDLAKRLRVEGSARALTAHGTLYKALHRMERAGWLKSQWEDADEAVEAGRPRRRLYAITPGGRAVLARASADVQTRTRPSTRWTTV